VFDKWSLAPNGRKMLGLLFMAGGIILLLTIPRHSLHHEVGFVGIFAGSAIMSLGTYRFWPAVLFTCAVLLGLGQQTWGLPALAVMVLGAVVNVYGWWKDRQAKALAERQTHRP